MDIPLVTDSHAAQLEAMARAAAERWGAALRAAEAAERAYKSAHDACLAYRVAKATAAVAESSQKAHAERVRAFFADQG